MGDQDGWIQMTRGLHFLEFLVFFKKLWRPVSQLPDVVQRPFSTQNYRLEVLFAHKHLPALGEA